jgi:hypothetical protein
VFDLARTVHDSIDSLSPEGEQRHISSLISGFIAKVRRPIDLVRPILMGNLVAKHPRCHQPEADSQTAS